jgi:hypothetical protein
MTLADASHHPRRKVTACGTLSPVFVRKVELCREWTETVLEAVADYEDVTHTNMGEVENRHRSGFIPFTDGGFDGLGYGDMRYAYGSGCVPQAIQPYIDRALKDIEEDWDREHPEHPVDWIFESEEPQVPLPGFDRARTTRERLREEYHEFEDANMSGGGTYFYKVRVLFHGDEHSSESGEPEAFFMVGINTDFEYGRDTIPWLACCGQSPKCTKWLWEKTVKIRNLNKRRVDSLIRQAINALGNA